MKRFWLVTGVGAITAIALAGICLLFSQASVEVLGMEAVCAGSEDPCWVTFGGVGVLVFGAGFGVVEIGLYGVGVLFATGQLAAGALCLAQLGAGPVFYFGQVGGGVAGVGQLVLGYFVRSQAFTTEAGKGFLGPLNDELNRLLSFRG